MKICFLCGSLEPGKDGVGDYTRRLACELIRQGHNILLFSLRDHFVDSIKEDVQDDEGTEVKVYRLPLQLSWTDKRAYLQFVINEFDPSWLSLQFVPYSFQKKGLPLFMARRLKDLGEGRRWHIMFHELWIYPHVETKLALKHRIIRFFQKMIIINSIKLLKPLLITTSLPLYKAALKPFQLHLLPLFSNIPIYGNDEEGNARAFIKVICFGSYSTDLDGFERQLTWLKQKLGAGNRKIKFISIGEGGRYKAPSLALAMKIFGVDSISDLGERSPKQISIELSSADIGVARADATFWGKSGSTIAMLEHGLPVVLKGNKTDIVASNEFHSPEQLLLPGGNSSPLKKGTKRNGVALISEKFVSLLKFASDS